MFRMQQKKTLSVNFQTNVSMFSNMKRKRKQQALRPNITTSFASSYFLYFFLKKQKYNISNG